MALCLGLKIFVTSTVISSCVASLDFFIDQDEVKKLLGIPAELYYVRDGVVNEHAAQFVILVPSHVTELHFTWQNRAGQAMPYALGTVVTDPSVLATPQLNVSRKGLVPVQQQVFRLFLPCTGVATAEVDVQLIVNVSLNPDIPKITSVVLPRKKVCLKDVDRDLVLATGISLDSSSWFYIAIGLSCSVMLLILFAVVFFYIRGKKSCLHQTVSSASASPSIPVFLPEPKAEANASAEPLLESRSGNGADQISDLQAKMARVLVVRSRVTLCSVLLEGTFGRVYHGVLASEEGKPEDEEQVLVKTVTESASPIQLSLLLQEGLCLFGLTHQNLLTITAVVAEGTGPPLLLFPLANSSNLKRWLHTCHAPPEGLGRRVSTQEVVAMALQVLKGLRWLHQNGLLHRDLATRNCIVDEDLHVKVADNALSRDLFPNDYHCLGDNENRPVKWLALESLVHRHFSPASDVWAFGVLLWELASLAQQPYVEVDPFEMATHLRRGCRLVQPLNCPDRQFSIMAYCWALAPEDRPTSSQLQICLRDFLHQLDKYI